MQSSCSSPYASVGIRHHWPLICAIFSQGSVDEWMSLGGGAVEGLEAKKAGVFSVVIALI